jgi:CheY-like chemotaxis protein
LKKTDHNAKEGGYAMNVLIVDDGDLNRTILGEILKFEGYLTIEVEDGMEALAALDAGDVHVIISDLLMPRMDGLRLCTEVRKRQETRNIPFIL